MREPHIHQLTFSRDTNPRGERAARPLANEKTRVSSRSFTALPGRRPMSRVGTNSRGERATRPLANEKTRAGRPCPT